MKFNKIKSYFGAIVAAIVLGFTSTSCVNDLNVQNINPQVDSELDPDALFNKVYASFVLTGQQGPAGSSDVTGDEGRSQFTRMLWYLQELPTDELHWEWATNDGYDQVEMNNQSANELLSSRIYYRMYFTLTLCNYYLDQIADDGKTNTETAHRRAEVRFIRALNYYYIMDLFGNGCFVEHFDNQLGEYYTRKQFYDFVESELLDIEPCLVDAGENTYGRIDKVADWLLLARLYLNAEVYTGTAQWEKAKSYANKVITEQKYYHLNVNGATNPSTGEKYNAYQMLFLADNDQNGAEREDIFPLLTNAITTKSYGGMVQYILGAYSANMSSFIPSGTSNSWGRSYSLKGKLTSIFGLEDDAIGINNIADMVAKANNDGRALFFSASSSDADPVSSRAITSFAVRTEGFGCVKFRNVRSDGQQTSTVGDDFVDTDQPFMRMAEAYLTLAEADFRTNDLDGAYNNIKKLRDRAGAPEITKASISLDEICNEWAREFWLEGRRRMDLIRFNKFGGQNSYKWEFMGGVQEGNQFSKEKNIYGIPTTDLTNNANLKQNPGY